MRSPTPPTNDPCWSGPKILKEYLALGWTQCEVVTACQSLGGFPGVSQGDLSKIVGGTGRHIQQRITRVIMEEKARRSGR